MPVAHQTITGRGVYDAAGHTVMLIEHYLDVIKTADHIIDLGPEGGHAGGEVVVTGTPEDIAACQASHTGRFLKARLRG